MIRKLLEIIDKTILSEIDAFDSSIILEKFICDNYDEIALENENIAIFANDDIVDIVEQMEPGMNPTKYLDELKEVKEIILKMIN